jgi:hypothetical protein
MHIKKGFILIFTLLFISLSVGLGTYLFVKGQVYTPAMRAHIDREKARTLAFSGIHVALSQVSYFPGKEKKEGREKKSETADATKKLYERILPTLNRWQDFTLTEAIDGVDAKLRLCISCENGKIDLNQVYDFKKHAFKGEGSPQEDMKKALQELCTLIQKSTGQADLFSVLESMLKKRSYRLNDVTELLTQKPFSIFKHALFYEPPSLESKNKKRPIYLTDLFTTWSCSGSLNPVVLSDSLCGIFEFKRVQPGDEENRKGLIDDLLKSFAQGIKSQLNKLLIPLYGKDFATLPQNIQRMFRVSDEPLVFGVLATATVNGVTQRAYAIISCSAPQESERGISFDGKIKKVYWL